MYMKLIILLQKIIKTIRITHIYQRFIIFAIKYYERTELITKTNKKYDHAWIISLIMIPTPNYKTVITKAFIEKKIV